MDLHPRSGHLWPRLAHRPVLSAMLDAATPWVAGVGRPRRRGEREVSSGDLRSHEGGTTSLIRRPVRHHPGDTRAGGAPTTTTFRGWMDTIAKRTTHHHAPSTGWNPSLWLGLGLDSPEGITPTSEGGGEDVLRGVWAPPPPGAEVRDEEEASARGASPTRGGQDQRGEQTTSENEGNNTRAQGGEMSSSETL